MSIATRLSKIERSASQTKLILRKSRYESIYSVRSLSHSGSNYQIRLCWYATNKIEDIKYSIIQVECNRVVVNNKNNYSDCEGQRSWLCYHALGTIIRQAEDSGKDIQIFDTFSQAYQAHLDIVDSSKLVKITSAQSSQKAWAVVTKKEETNHLNQYDSHLANRLERFERRVAMMHGEREIGID